MKPTEKLKNTCIGIVIGVASMLPGVSGAIVAVCFGVYERLVGDVADFRHKLFTDFWFILTVIGGAVVGMVLCAKVLDGFMDSYLAVCLFFFLGLIAGQLPEIKGYATPDNGSKPTAMNVLALLIGFVVAFVFVFFTDGTDTGIGESATGFLTMVVVGVIFAASKLAPGISGSTVLLAMGLYGPMLNSISDLNMMMLVPLLIGLLIGIFGFARVVYVALIDHRTSTFNCILGLTLGSLVVVAVYGAQATSGALDYIGGIVAAVVGFAVSMIFMKLGKGKES